MAPKKKSSKSSQRDDERRRSPRTSTSKKPTPAVLSLQGIAKKYNFKKKKSSEGRFATLEYGIEDLTSPAQLADDEKTEQARPPQRKIPKQTTARLPKHIKERQTNKETPHDPDVMDTTEDVPWTRPTRGFSLPRSSELVQRDQPAIDAMDPAVQEYRRCHAPPPLPAPRAPSPPPPAVAASAPFEERKAQAKKLIAGKASLCDFPGNYPDGGRKSYRTQLLEELLRLGFAHTSKNKAPDPITAEQRLAKMRSSDPTAVLKNYEDYGIMPREARPRYPGFREPGPVAAREKCYARYTNMCLEEEKYAIEDWARTLFLRANGISEEELEYNEGLGLVDHKFEIRGPLHRMNAQAEDWYMMLPDVEREEVYDEQEDDIYDASGRSLGKPVRRLWRVQSIRHHAFEENIHNPRNALHAYWSYHGDGLIPKGAKKYIPYPQRAEPRGPGELEDIPMTDFSDDEKEQDPQISALRERQRQTSLRRAEQLYVYEYAKALRAKEFGLNVDEFEKALAKGEIDEAWAAYTPDTNRTARYGAPGPEHRRRGGNAAAHVPHRGPATLARDLRARGPGRPQVGDHAPVWQPRRMVRGADNPGRRLAGQQPLYRRPDPGPESRRSVKDAIPSPPSRNPPSSNVPAGGPNRRGIRHPLLQRRAMTVLNPPPPQAERQRSQLQQYRTDPMYAHPPPRPSQHQPVRSSEHFGRITRVLFRHQDKSYRWNALQNGLIITPATAVPPRSAGEAVFLLHAYTTTGTLPPGFVRPEVSDPGEWGHFQDFGEWEAYLHEYEREVRGIEQNEVLRFLRRMRAEELGLGYEEFKRNRGEGRISGYAEGWKVVGVLVKGEGGVKRESRWAVVDGEGVFEEMAPVPGTQEWRRRNREIGSFDPRLRWTRDEV